MMDTKLVVAATGAGMYSLEIDTNRFTTDFGHSSTGHLLVVVLGIILAIVLMAITFRYIKAERKVARILKASQEKEAAEGEGDAAKVEIAKDKEEEGDDDEDDFSSVESEIEPGKKCGKCRKHSKYVLKCRCIRGASF